VLLLHLSDIHFQLDEISTPMDPNIHLRNELLRDAKRMCEQLRKAPSAIIVSGDIAFAAHDKEYLFALSWLESLAETCGTTIESIFVVPGNHDVDRHMAARPAIQAYHHDIKSARPVSLDGILRGLLTDIDARQGLYAPLNNYNFFAEQFFCDVSPPSRTIAKRSLILNDGSILKLMGLNSAFVSSQADKRGDLFVDPACFQIIREHGVENVTVCHHPFTWLRNGDALKDHLDAVTRIQLFGHDHTNRVFLSRDSVCVAASAAHPDRTEHGWEPGYNLIEVEVINTDSKRKFRVITHVRVWQPQTEIFQPKMDKEKTFFQHEITLDNWQAPSEKEGITANLTESSSSNTISPITKQHQARSDPMDTLRNTSVRFFKLTLSQKSAIAGKLGLIEDDDMNQPDFERFRRVFLRARDRNLISDLDREISSMRATTATKTS